MAAAARERVLRAYTVDAMCAATLEVYRDLYFSASRKLL